MRSKPSSRVIAIGLLGGLVLLASCAGASSRDAKAISGSAAPSPWESRRNDLADEIDETALTDRFLEASVLFLGATYFDGPLGEGEVGGPDPDPRVDFERADCVTYLEQSLALALEDPGKTPSQPSAFLAILDRIRYRDGQVGFAERNHYMYLDWMAANAWLVEDVTKSVGPDVAVDIVRTIDRAQFLRDKGIEPRAGLDDPRSVTISIIPRESAAAVDDAIQAGDLIFWAGKRDGIDFVHTGLAARNAEGVLLFRHASSKAGQVTEEPLADYATRATFTSGFAVLRLKPDAAATLAQSLPPEPIH